MQPIDYLTPMGGLANLPNPTAAMNQGIADGIQIRQMQAKEQSALIAAQKAAQREAQKARDIQAALTNPSASSFARLQTLYPEDREAYKSAWEAQDVDQQKTDLRQIGAIHSYLQGGFPDQAAAELERRIAADKAAGQDVAEDEALLTAIQTDPTRAAGVVAYMLSNLVDPKDFAPTLKATGDVRRSEATLPGDVRKGVAEAGKTEVEAAYAEPIVKSELATAESERRFKDAAIQNNINRLSLDWERLNLDKDTLATNTALKVEELTQNGQEIKGASLATLTESVASAQQNQALADRTSGLADRIATSSIRGGGWRSWLGEAAADTFGTQDAMSALRAEYAQLVRQGAMKTLPPGSASDADVRLAMEGFPPPTADKEYIVSWLRGMAKVQASQATADERRADWISANKDLGTAKRDIQVGGIVVPRGTTFGEFNKNATKFEKRGTPPPALDNILKRYGQ